MFDLPDAQAQADVAQWKPIIAWLDPVLRVVRRPELRGNPSVERPPGAAATPMASASEVVDVVATPFAAVPSTALPSATVPSAAAMPIEAKLRAIAPIAPSIAARPAIVEPLARPAPARLGLFGWLTPRFLHR